jgi:hypothetical protein
VMYGGFAGFSPAERLTDTWAWDGKGWTQRHPRTVPTLQGSSMTYDAANGELFMVGFQVSGQTQNNSVWTWKDGDWVQKAVWMTPSCGKSCPANLSVPFASGLVTYDSARSRVLMLAGGPGGPGSQTWTWTGSNWIQIQTAHRPQGLSCCAHDSATGHILSLGYSGGSWGGINRLWVFDGTDWTLTATSTPSGDATIVDDPATGTALMLRSPQMAIPSPGETWTWTGSSWQKLDATSPPVLPQSTLGYDAADKQVILFGGRAAYGQFVNDTWVWNGHTWQKQTSG